jgi:hypothetical protein
MATIDLNELEPPTTDDADLLVARLRMYRDRLLAESDWAMTSDAPTDKQEWTGYRQALRDLPADPNWPNVNIPDPPA